MKSDMRNLAGSNLSLRPFGCLIAAATLMGAILAPIMAGPARAQGDYPRA